MGNGEVSRRIRGIWLDPEKVRYYAGKADMKSEEALEARYIEHHRSEKGITVVKNAWRGYRPAEKQYAQRLARCLGLQDYFSLERTELQSSLWKRLITGKEVAKPFMRFERFIPEDTDESRLFTDPSDERDREHLDRYPLDICWHLEFDGKREQKLFILLRSEEKFFQVAPIDGERFLNRFNSGVLRYPSEGELAFTKSDGGGWRQFIAVRANKIETMARNRETGYACTLDDLESFARRLLAREAHEDIAVDAYEFMLTDLDSSSESG